MYDPVTASTVLWKLYEPRIQELDQLIGIEGQIEWLEKELRLMRTSLVSVKSVPQPGDDLKNWANEAGEVFRDMENVIDTFQSISGRNRTRMRSVFFIRTLIYRHKLSVKLEKLKVKVRDVSKRRPTNSSSASHHKKKEMMIPRARPIEATAMASTSQGPGIIQLANTSVASVITTIESILNENLIVRTSVIKLAQQIRDEFIHLRDVLDDAAYRPVVPEGPELEQLELLVVVLNERGKAWAEEAKCVAEFAQPIFDSFITKIQNKVIFKIPFLDPRELKLGKDMKEIHTRIQNLHGRKQTYGFRDFGAGERPTTSLVPITTLGGLFSQTVQKILDVFLGINIFLFPYFYFASSLLDISQQKLNRELALWRPVGYEIESIRAELKLSIAFLKDVEGIKDLGERVDVWVEEMRDISCIMKDFVNADHGKKRGILRNMIAQRKTAKKINQIKNRVDEIFTKKGTYDIGVIEGRKGPCFVKVSQDREDEASSTRHIGNSGEDIQQSTQRACLDISNLIEFFRLGLQSNGKVLREQVEWTKREFKLMQALLNDVKSMEGKDKRLTVWANEMQGVANDAKKLINFYQDNKVPKGKFSIKRCYLTYHKVPKTIERIKSHIEDISKRKRTYDVGGITARNGQSSEITEISDPSNSEETRHRSMKKNLLPIRLYFPWQDHELEEKVESIRKELSLMYALFEDIEQLERLDEGLKAWIKEMKTVSKDAETAIEEYDAMTKKSRWIIDPMRYQAISKNIKSIMRKIQDVSERRIVYGIGHIKGIEESNITGKIKHWTSPPLVIEEQGIIGLHDNVQAVMAQLLADNDRSSIISIVGMEGIGKTALVRLIYNNEAIQKHFPCRDWVEIPPGCNAKVLEDIKVRLMRKQTTTTTTTALNRYLFVLDNVRKIEDWDTLKEAFKSTLSGSRIVLTTHKVEVAIHADSKSVPHRLKLLNDDDSWSLFANNLIIPLEVVEQSRKAVTECGGLPQTIVKLKEQVAHLESNSEWSEVLEKLDLDHKPWLEIFDVVEKWLPMNLKHCLFYVGLFRQKFEIPTRRLVLLWVAENFVHLSRDDEDELVVEGYLTNLVDGNLVQVTKRKLNGEVKRFRLPFPLQKLWLSEAERAYLSRRVSDHFDQKDQPIFDHIHGDTPPSSSLLRQNYKNLLSFLSFDTRTEKKSGEDVGNFLKRCIYSGCFDSLRVLDLESVFRPKLPEAVAKLTQLRYLGLRWTCLETLPLFVSKLLNLQTLDVKHTQISAFPKSFWRMQQLRHLYMDEIYHCRFVPRPSGHSLTNLQTLWGAFVDEMSPVKDGLDTFTNLRKLGLQCRPIFSEEDKMSSQLEAVAEWVSKLENLRSLRLISYNETGQPWDLHLNPLSKNSALKSLYLLGRIKNPSVVFEFPKSLTEITLSASGLIKDPMQPLKDLPNLRVLQLLSASYTDKNMCCALGGFQQLRVLKLWKLEELEMWVVEERALPSLRDLEIRSCTNLNMLPDGLRHVRTLKEFKISDMPKKFNDRIKVKQGEDWDKIAHVSYFYLDDIWISKRDTVTKSLSVSDIKQTQKASQICRPKIEHSERIFLRKIALRTLEAEIPLGTIECPFCGTEPESEEHLFFLCKVVKMIWFSKWGLKTDDFSHLSISDWITRICDPSLIFRGSPPGLGEINFELFAVILMEKTWLWRKKVLSSGVAVEPDTIYGETCSEFKKRLMQEGPLS